MRRVPMAILCAGLFGLIGCSGGGTTNSNGTGPVGPTNGPHENDDVTPPPPDSPGLRLVILVEEIAGKVEAAEGCDALAGVLGEWLDHNRQTIEALLGEIEQQGDTKEAGQLNQRVVNGYLVVIEALAECGSNDAAMRAYDSFDEAVQKATY